MRVSLSNIKTRHFIALDKSNRCHVCSFLPLYHQLFNQPIINRQETDESYQMVERLYDFVQIVEVPVSRPRKEAIPAPFLEA